jgi:hypothetical protein
MPIKPENKHLYPANWAEISHHIIHVRAENKCEFCGLPNHAVGYRAHDGKFIPVGGNIVLDLAGSGRDYPSVQLLPYKKAKEVADHHTADCDYQRKYIVIVLTTMHLDHDPTNNTESNLKVACQQCHNQYDAKHRQSTKKKTQGEGMGSLF